MRAMHSLVFTSNLWIAIAIAGGAVTARIVWLVIARSIAPRQEPHLPMPTYLPGGRRYY